METALAKRFPLQSAATTGNGAVADLMGSSREISIYIAGSAGVSAGAVQVETADDAAYAGTWAPLGSATTITADTQKILQFTGCFGAVRARVSTNVVGGTVTVTLFAD